MTYKKYVKRGGKVYGPYAYSGKGIDENAVSEYNSLKSGMLNYKRISLAVAGLFALLMGAYFLVQFDGEFFSTGMVTVDLDGSYNEGIFEDGKINISLNEGEFIPASSLVVLENNGQEIFSSELRGLVSEEPVNGSFYISGVDISGVGEGYGVLIEETNPEVSFELIIIFEDDSIPESVGDDLNGSGESNGQEDVNESEDEGLGNDTGDTSEYINDENDSEEGATEEDEISDNGDEELTEEEGSEEESSAEEGMNASGIESGSVSLSAFGITTKTDSDSDRENIVSRIAGVFKNMFSSPELTGFVVSGGEEEELNVSGSVSAGEEFIYDVEEGNISDVSVVSDSVRTDSEIISDDEISVKIRESEVIVTTNYSGTEGNFEINLPDDLEVEEGSLTVRIIYLDEEISSYEIEVTGDAEESNGNGEPVNETIPEPEEPDLDDEVNETVPDFNESEGEVVSELSLNATENQTLVDFFGEDYMSEVENSKEEIERNWEIVLVYELGDYYAEFAYDSELSEEAFESFVERDRNGWLKDIARSLS